MQIEKLDHVHVEVTDREAAAVWYGRVLGLSRHAGLAHWAKHPQGPLILAAPDGEPTLSLFAGASREHTRDNTVAFRVSGEVFLAFLDGLDETGLVNRFGAAVARDQVLDHDVSWSIYFVDPDQNRIEITTYDYAMVGGAL
ncbi:MAG: VOC family protein [Pseudomonadota bacterium]